MSFAENENVIQTLAPDRTDEALGERILPGAVRRREDFTDVHALHRRVIIELRFSPDQSRQINHLAARRGFGEGRVSDPRLTASFFKDGWALREKPVLAGLLS